MQIRFLTILSNLIVPLMCMGSNKGGSLIEKKDNRPNIILFFVDDLGWSDLGFRNPVFETPNIDKLANRGINFMQAYIACPTSSPSRATLLTGKHPARLQIIRHIPEGKKNSFDKYGRTTKEFNYLESDPAYMPSRNWLSLDNITYAEALKKLGYYNLFVGKWHLGSEKYYPIHQGFDKEIGVTNYGQPYSYYPPYFKYSSVFAEEKDRYLTDKLTDETVKFIEQYHIKKPFMISLFYYAVHSPHQGRKDLVEHFKMKWLSGKYAEYAAMVKAVDESVGRILESIRKKGVEKNTIIIFLSDQGGYFENPPFRGGKMGGTALYEGGCRVPFFFIWPGVTHSGTVSNSIVQSTDLFPTLIEIAGGDASKYQDIDGCSLLPIIKENKQIDRDTIFFYRAYENLYAAVRAGDWKLLVYRDGKRELYNIAKDIKEEKNLAMDSLLITNKLSNKLIEWEKKMGVEKYSGLK
jgi:arylsulfatase A-like enzyme